MRLKGQPVRSFAAVVCSAADRLRYEWSAPGTLYNTNTLEAFKQLDKSALLQREGDQVLALIRSRPSQAVAQLNAFVLVTFADLKKHSFLYWFGFPAPLPPSPYRCKEPVAVATVLSAVQQQQALQGLWALRVNGAVNGSPFFVLDKPMADDGQMRVLDLQTWIDSPESSTSDTLFGFVDPCPLPGHPGWPLRNYLALLTALPKHKIDTPSFKILSFRDPLHHVAPDIETTAASLSLTESSSASYVGMTRSLIFEVEHPAADSSSSSQEPVKVAGWEANARGKMGPRIMELADLLDPIRLAETSVDLNLKLMLWRQLPSLRLDMIAQTKCLLLGAGTLGCYTARSLLSWGFRHFTFVDNSVVSHSNPVRQPLFEFADVGKPKGECAANALKRIFPLVESKAVHLTIPMAGHALSNETLVQEAQLGLTRLQELIEEHDVVFLGTDSRESRWLPTVICAAKQKMLMNTALGFDSYLVMRHGVPSEAPSSSSSSCSLGCYFCNDIVSPRDSLKDRTLDQMCTVTRPGLAPIAAATAVELLVAVLHAPKGKFSGADKPADGSAPMGYIPHQLRGFLNAFDSVVVTGQAFDKCIACSRNVLAAYEADSMELLANACNSSGYLEELTGLHQLTQEADSLMLDLEDSDDDSELV